MSSLHRESTDSLIMGSRVRANMKFTYMYYILM